MMSYKFLAMPAVVAALVCMIWFATGCSGLSKPYPEKTLHAISVGQTPVPVQSAVSVTADGGLNSATVLRINAVRVARPFDGLSLVYKTGESQFTSDYYNGFITSPDRMLTGELMRWMSASGVFSTVVAGDSAADAQLSLETSVTQFYGDFSNPAAPTAVVEASFFLIDEGDGSYKVVFTKQYSAIEPIASRSPDELIKGLDRAYRRVLTELTDDLAKRPSAPKMTSAQQ